MENKIRCNPNQPRYGALHVLNLPVQVTRGALVAHWYTYPPSHSTAGLLFPSVSLWNYLAGLVFNGVELAGFKSRSNGFLLA